MDRKELLRQRRHRRVRKKVFGTPDKPRLNVFRSLCNIYAQIIDDTRGHTLVSASTLDAELKSALKTGGNIEAAREVGKLVGSRQSCSTAAATSTTAGWQRWRTARERRG